ncbi:UNVERIFIED_CONTAM: hypothetical protein GTU68_045035 [Idotea baltica]|nr:hypothetical protein [Idotea baltica]
MQRSLTARPLIPPLAGQRNCLPRAPRNAPRNLVKRPLRRSSKR